MPILIAESLRIMEKKRLDLAIMPEEYKSLANFADIVERLMQEEREASPSSLSRSGARAVRVDACAQTL